MKTTYILGLLAFGVSLTACTADDPSNNSNANPGDDIEFLINSNGTRTMYGEENADSTAQGLYWGNYNDWIGDSIKIFSPQCRFGKARYVVNKQSTNSNVAASVTRIGENGLQWGDASTAHDFYAFYPASGCGEDATEAGVVDAWIQQGQSPVKFVSSTQNGKTVYLGQPNMNACVMTACTLVQPADYGKPVSLHFRPLATVLDVTVNGPMNMANGDIYMITLRSKSGKEIAGNFKADMKDNKFIEGSITQGSSEIVMQPRNMQYDATSHQPTAAGRFTLSPESQMKVRFFLIPREDLDLSDLQLIVTTQDREYRKTLTPADVSGSETTAATLPASKITKVTLPVFEAANGREFSLNYWASELQPNIYLTELTIPGAYNAASSTLSDDNKMQAVEAQYQFESGIRAFKLSVYNKFSYTGNGNNKKYSSKTLYYGNSGTYGSNTNKEDNISIGTVASLFKKLHDWLKAEKTNWTNDHPNEPFQDFVVLCLAPNRYFNGGSDTKYYEQSYEIANSLISAIKTYNNSNDGKEIPVYGGPITPETTISDVAGKIIIHYNASSDYVNNNTTTVTGGLKQPDSPSNISGADMLFSFWNAPTDEKFYSMPQLVHMSWGAPPTTTTPITSLPDDQLGWLFYEFNGIASATGGNFVTKEQMTSAISNYGTISYQNYLFKKHNIWAYIEIGGRDKTASTDPSAAWATSMANTFNPIMYNYVISGQRPSAPYGMVMMNFADNSSEQAIAAKSPDLIRALITHNRLFWLQRKTAQPSETSLINDRDIVSAHAWDAPRRK